jgi:hypothetical protein
LNLPEYREENRKSGTAADLTAKVGFDQVQDPGKVELKAKGYPHRKIDLRAVLPNSRWTNEIPCIKPLLDPMDIEGSFVTADSLHIQTETPRCIVEDKKADYVFTVKDNRPALKQNIQDLGLEAFPLSTLTRPKVIAASKPVRSGPAPSSSAILTFLMRRRSSASYRKRFDLNKQKEESEAVFGITSLIMEKSSPVRLLSLNCLHWEIENKFTTCAM